MEPPCEHGGVQSRVHDTAGGRLASMEPPCEHGGVPAKRSHSATCARLQWSRRVNTAECSKGSGSGHSGGRASMEPPCEHGGVMKTCTACVCECALQWSRRVNTAEWKDLAMYRTCGTCFNGAAV